MKRTLNKSNKTGKLKDKVIRQWLHGEIVKATPSFMYKAEVTQTNIPTHTGTQSGITETDA